MSRSIYVQTSHNIPSFQFTIHHSLFLIPKRLEKAIRENLEALGYEI